MGLLRAAWPTIFLCGACTSITGLADLGVEPESNIDAPNRDRADGGVPSDTPHQGDGDGSVVRDSNMPPPIDTDAEVKGDAKVDPPDVIVPPPPTAIRFQCVAAANPPPNNASGLVLSDTAWPAFRFEVPVGKIVTVDKIGLNIQSGTTNKLFAALVRLTGAGDNPDAPDLSSADRIATVLIDVIANAQSQTISASVPALTILNPGWYAAVFGTGAFNAGTFGATVFSQSGAGGCTNGSGYPFSILKGSSSPFIAQAATPHVFVTGTHP